MDNNIIFQPIPKTHNFKNIVGQTFFKLTVIGYAGFEKGNTFWYCRCECGNIKKISKNNLRNKSIKSCGCYRHEFAQNNSVTHGGAKDGKSPEYLAYIQAKMRCNNPNRPQFKDYGGRGIEFRFTSFPEFLTEVGIKPTPKHSLDRIDVNGNYEKGNVRWATFTQQTQNQRKTRHITINGETKIMAEWCRIYNVKVVTVHSRIARGWCEICAFTSSKCTHKS